MHQGGAGEKCPSDVFLCVCGLSSPACGAMKLWSAQMAKVFSVIAQCVERLRDHIADYKKRIEALSQQKATPAVATAIATAVAVADEEQPPKKLKHV